MVSVIVCSRQDPEHNLHERNVRATAAGATEYLRIENRDRRLGICAAYNLGMQQAKGDIFVFMHEDAFFMERGWDVLLEEKFQDQSVGLVGVAGTQHLFGNPPGWVAAGRPFIKGKVVHETDGGARFHLTVFSWDADDAEVVAVDGLFFAVRKGLFSRIRFDEAAFDGFHFYDLDLCMQIRETHRLVVTPGMIIKHQSGGSYDEAWLTYAQRFARKWAGSLPASCANGVPDLSRRIPFETFDLKGKVPQVTIT